MNINHYISVLTEHLVNKFGSRLIYLGLQGSYLRGEENKNSDIDIMVVLDSLRIEDMDQYRMIVKSMEHGDFSCGFICGKADIANWNPLEICHLVNSTKDYYGVLSELVPDYSETDIRNFVKMSLNNLYHEICHRYIHRGVERSKLALPETYQSVFFILQNLTYLRKGIFAVTKVELLDHLDGKDHQVLERAMNYKQGFQFDFDESFALLFTWCQETLQSV